MVDITSTQKTLSRNVKRVAGVFVFGLWQSTVLASTDITSSSIPAYRFTTANNSISTKLSPPDKKILLQQCLAGFSQPQENTTKFTTYSNPNNIEAITTPSATLSAKTIEWMTAQHWLQAYTLWRTSFRCQNDIDKLNPMHTVACQQTAVPLPKSRECAHPQNSYDFFVMHRFLLQAMTEAWPELKTDFNAWKSFPQQDDYPEKDQAFISAWSNEVLQSASIADKISPMRKADTASRWNSEMAFTHWLGCGSTEPGQSVDALYPSLLFNGVRHLYEPQLKDEASPLTSTSFWLSHSWMNNTWERYRRSSGLKPQATDLQAAMLKQCVSFLGWAHIAGQLPTTHDTSTHLHSKDRLFNNGELSPAYDGLALEILGEVIDLKTIANRQFIKLDTRLVGVKPLWVSTYSQITKGRIQLADRLLVKGYVHDIASFSNAETLQEILQSPSLLMAESLQSPK